MIWSMFDVWCVWSCPSCTRTLTPSIDKSIGQFSYYLFRLYALFRIILDLLFIYSLLPLDLIVVRHFWHDQFNIYVAFYKCTSICFWLLLLFVIFIYIIIGGMLHLFFYHIILVVMHQFMICERLIFWSWLNKNCISFLWNRNIYSMNIYISWVDWSIKCYWFKYNTRLHIYMYRFIWMQISSTYIFWIISAFLCIC